MSSESYHGSVTESAVNRDSNSNNDPTDPSYWSEKLWSEDGAGDFIWDEDNPQEDETRAGEELLPSVGETGDFIWSEDSPPDDEERGADTDG